MTIHVPVQPTCNVASALDQFFTRPEIAKACYGRLVELYPVQTGDLWIEPSAGAGAFLELMPKMSIGLDLVPAADGVTYADYLDWTPPSGFQRHVVVGNPPFGRNTSTAVAFFNRAAEHAQVIAMILPRSVRKSSVRRRLDAMFHLVDEILLPSGAFVHEGKPVSVRTVFQIWERRDHARVEAPVRTSHPDFVFCDAAEAEFAIRRVGGVAGRIFDDLAHRAPNSHIFVKAAEGVSAERLRDRFAQLDFSEVREDSVAHYSVAKSDVVALYEALVIAEGQASPSVDRNAIGPKNPPREDRQEGLANKAGCQQPREAQRLEPKARSTSEKSSPDVPPQNSSQTTPETSPYVSRPARTPAVRTSHFLKTGQNIMENKTKVSELMTANLSVRNFELYAHTENLLFLEAELVFELAAKRVHVVAEITISGENVSVHAERIQDEMGEPIVGEHLLAGIIANRREEIADLVRAAVMTRA
ncbi:hypothetical protein [Thioclava nitratireducens]|uniref:hypothetical protein n=1 Tax=Thioclava nitratireducens TaxID=1915078 RepID=UPI002481305E|nr:hypothetical protein [Thioclava nitratireducens]WGT52614.1 hypothetical protein P0N61_20200 [Thioclava nitratireducens]